MDRDLELAREWRGNYGRTWPEYWSRFRSNFPDITHPVRLWILRVVFFPGLGLDGMMEHAYEEGVLQGILRAQRVVSAVPPAGEE